MKLVPGMQKGLLVLCISVVMSTAFFCAGQVSPSGGPPDTTPPEIINTYPVPGTLHFQDTRISLQFSKYVDKSRLQESIFISPPVGRLRFEWGGAGVEIKFADSLRADATYIVTIGTDLVDTRNNRMAKAFSLPFSTGDHIDSASISGRVFDANPEGVTIFAYGLDRRKADTLNPARTRPDYVTQTGKDGTFALTYLALGNYRIFAVHDEFKNYLYDPQTDRYGIAPGDLQLSGARHSVSGIQFQMADEDTTPPFLSSARALDRTHVLLRFSEAMDTTAFATGALIADTIDHVKLAVDNVSFTGESSLQAQLVTASQDSSKTYRVTLIGWKDLHGNRLLEPSGSGVFAGAATPDTSKPVMNLPGIADSASNVQTDDTVRLVFSEAIRTGSFERGFRFLDSARQNVGGTAHWDKSTAFSFLPSPPLSFGVRYTLRVEMDSVMDFAGNHFHDSIWVRHFQTVQKESLGSIEGTVADDEDAARGPIRLIAAELSRKQMNPYRTALEKPGTFLLENILEGSYVLSGFRDSDSDGVYTPGRPYPFSPSERFVIYPETLSVRARWPLEGVQVHFKK